MSLKPLEINHLPSPPAFRKLLGPSFILLGLGLGSGEVILWPYLAANYGLGIIWGALIGITFQFVINMEVERYALAHGESVFVGLYRRFRWLPVWFFLSTFIPWVWPGIIASSAKLLGTVIGFSETSILAVMLLTAIGILLSLGRYLYKTVETMQKWIIGLGVPMIFCLAFLMARGDAWLALGKGIVGAGEGYWLLPKDIILSSFLAALAYAGAGGNLNLAQAFYIREKGYGMGKYAGRITSLITGKNESVSLTGYKFEPTVENIGRFRAWWRTVNVEHFLVFWLTGSLTILFLALLSYATVYGQKGMAGDIGFVIEEAKAIGQRLAPFAGTLFLLVGSLTLFGTQLTVLDATSRILTENTVLAFYPKTTEKQIPKIYYSVLWLQIITGIAIIFFGFNQPLTLLTLSAILNAVAMFVHTGLTLWLNLTSLDSEIRPSPMRISLMLAALLFYGGFCLFTLWSQLI